MGDLRGSSFVPVMLALGVLFAGCLGVSKDPSALDEPAAAVPPVALDCSISNWGDACTALASANDAPSKTEVDIAVNPTDPLNVFVASKDMDPLASDNCVWSVGHVTKDGGATWKTVYVGGTMEERRDPSHPMYGWACVTDPIMTFDAEGVLYYPMQAYNDDGYQNRCFTEPPLSMLPPAGCGSAFFLAVSHDGGETFPFEDIVTLAVADGNAVIHDYPRVLVNPATGTVSTVWNAIPAGSYVVSTRDGGRTIDPPFLLPGLGFGTGFAADADGTVFMTSGGRLAVSRDDARTFGELKPMFARDGTVDCAPKSQFRCGKMGVELAADTSGGANDGRLYALYPDAPDGRQDNDIFVRWSDDEGTTWSEAVRVNQDNTTSGQWMHRLDVGPDGVVHALYMDLQYDPEHHLYDATYAWSEDGGATWTDMRLTSVSSDGDLGIHQDGGPFIGDYVGIDSSLGHVYAGFPQTVTGRAEVAVAHVVKNG